MHEVPSTRYQGSMVAMITPFTESGEIDFGAMKALIDYQRDGGSNALFFMGVAGEGSVLSDDEHEAVIANTKAYQPNNMTFVYGCVGNSTQHTISRVSVAAAYEADAAIITVPSNMGPTQQQTASFFLEVADRAAVPLGVFNNPARLLTDIDADTALQILSHPRYVLHKEGSPRTGQIGLILRQNPSVVFLADDSPDQDILVTSMALGAQGIANAVGNILPREMAALAEPWDANKDIVDFRSEYFRILPFIHFLYSFRSPIAIKGMMNALGLPAGHLRRPLTSLQEEDVKQGINLMGNLKISIVNE